MGRISRLFRVELKGRGGRLARAKLSRSDLDTCVRVRESEFVDGCGEREGRVCRSANSNGS